MVKTIFIVDDSNLIRRLCWDILSRQQRYLLMESANGTDFLRDARIYTPDLVLLDIEMPGISGLDLCKLIKSQSRYQQPLVIIMTSHTEPDVAAAALAAGADRFLHKPFTPLELQTMVSELLGESP